MASRLSHLVALGIAGCAALSLPSLVRACSVCECGDPLYSPEGASSQPAGSFSLFLDQRVNSKTSGELPDIGEPSNPGDREHSDDRTVTAYASWTPFSRLTLTASVPYRTLTITDLPADEPSSVQRNQGFADAALYVSAILWRDTEHPSTWLEGRVMLELPTGASRMKIDGDRDPHLQLGSGSWDYGFGLAGGHHFEHFLLYTSAFYRVNGQGSLRYRYGDNVLANVAVRSESLRVPGVGLLVRPGAELNFRYAAHDRFQADFYRSSGGAIFYLTPSLEIPFTKDPNERAPWLRLSARLPLGDGQLFGHQHEQAIFQAGIGMPF
jgi:hypothetical protein